MNQRSTSALRKLKTDQSQELHLERKTFRLAKDKKSTTTKIITPRNDAYKIPNYRPTDKYKGDKQISVTSINIQQKPYKYLKLNEEDVKEYCQSNNLDGSTCMNHPHKKGLFEEKQRKEYHYCPECAIRMVKMNIKLVNITPESLVLKSFLQEQLQKINKEEKIVKDILDDYYLSMRQMFNTFYDESHQARHHNSNIVSFADYQTKEDNVKKITECLGKVDEIKIKFITEDVKDSKQNFNGENVKEKYLMERQIYKALKDRSMDVGSETNRSIDHITQRSSSFIGRPRQSSSYYKKDKINLKTGAYMR